MKKATLSTFDHLLQYSPTTSQHKPFRATQIIATIRDNVSKDDIILMIQGGMAIARFDASTKEGKDGLKTIETSLETFREAVKEYNDKRRKEALKENPEGKCRDVLVATALDLKGSYIETGPFRKDTTLVQGNTVKITNDRTVEDNSDDQCIFINHPIVMSLKPDQLVVINEHVKLRVDKIDSSNDDYMICRVEKGGNLNFNQKVEVNIPSVIADLEGSETTITAINFCFKNGIDMLIAPINDPNAFKIIKCTAEAKDGKTLKVIAKLEGAAAVQNADKIIERADGVMISRGRLSRNISPEQVIVYQKQIIAKCLKAGIPSIVASDLLKAMECAKNEPTNAEIADIVNIVVDGADCVVLEDGVSDVECIEVLRNTIMETEDMMNYRRVFLELLTQVAIPSNAISGCFTNGIAISACLAATVNAASAIIVLTETGKTVRMISKYRPECPIIAVTSSPAAARQCLMYRGVISIHIEGWFELCFIKL